MSPRQNLTGWAVLLGTVLGLTAGCRSRDAEPAPASRAPAPSPAAEAPAKPPAPRENDDFAPPSKSTAPPRTPAAAAGRGKARPPAAAATGWGHLRGRFVYAGKPPAQKELKVTSDAEFCGPHRPLDESLVVNKDNSGVAYVVVSLVVGREDNPPPIHPSYAATAEDKIPLDNSKCRFAPHVVLLRTSQTLLVTNTDAIAHNTKIDTLSNPPINPTLPAGGSLEQRFTIAEARPVSVSCSIHPWMAAWVNVKDDPYSAATDADGKFEIRNLPAGQWTFHVWHEKARAVNQVTRDGKQVDWKRGRVAVEIKPDQTVDLGELGLSPKLFGLAAS